MRDSELLDLFPFRYVGTGYFRRKGVPAGEPAEIVHGMGAIIAGMRAAFEAGVSHAERKEANG